MQCSYLLVKIVFSRNQLSICYIIQNYLYMVIEDNMRIPNLFSKKSHAYLIDFYKSLQFLEEKKR